MQEREWGWEGKEMDGREMKGEGWRCKETSVLMEEEQNEAAWGVWDVFLHHLYL